MPCQTLNPNQQSITQFYTDTNVGKGAPWRNTGRINSAVCQSRPFWQVRTCWGKRRPLSTSATRHTRFVASFVSHCHQVGEIALTTWHCKKREFSCQHCIVLKDIQVEILNEKRKVSVCETLASLPRLKMNPPRPLMATLMRPLSNTG